MSHSFQVTFDAINPAKLADFWQEALGYERPLPPDGFDTWQAFLQSVGVPEEEWDKADALIDPDGDGPRLYFQKVPEAKTTSTAPIARPTGRNVGSISTPKWNGSWALAPFGSRTSMRRTHLSGQ